jgi:uncharacterized membrane protein YphA (DoxX/SURF4 family)
MFVVTIILVVLLALTFAMAGAQKAAGAKSATDQADHFGIAHGRYKIIGALELVAVIGLLAGLAVWPLGVAAGVGLVLLMVGAVIVHIRTGDKVAHFAPAIVLGALAAAEVVFRALSA